MSNFAFLEAGWPDLHAEAAHAERIAVAEPLASCIYARRCLELAMSWLYRADGSLRRPRRDDLASMIAELAQAEPASQKVLAKMDLIRKQGNAAAHRPGPVAPDDAVRVVGELFHVMYWLARTYARDQADLPAAGLAFDRTLIPRVLPAGVRPQSRAELQADDERLARRRAELAREHRRGEDEELDAEIARLRAEVTAAKAANAARPDDHDYNEAETRNLVIDLLLGEAGWRLDRARDREFPVTGMPVTDDNRSGTGRVDYVLWDDDGTPLAVVEAKRTSRDAKQGQHQATLYADCLERDHGRRPVVFYTNGYQTYIWDDLAYPPRQVQGFYTKDELRLLIQRRAGRRPLAGVSVNDQIAGRHYQARAVRRIGEAFERDRRRAALLVMATGAGKTRTVIALVDQLARANWVKRVLFLADRKALVTQAVNAFKEHLPGMPTVNLLTEKDAGARVFVSTYPTMLGLVNEAGGGLRRFGPGYFDLVVVDEAHRSIYQKYGAIFDYFDALLVGLTATPKEEVDRNTYRRFHLEDEAPTDVYDLGEAVAEGYLVAPRVVDVPLKFQREGIRYADLSEAEKDAWDEAEWSEDGAVPNEISSEELNKYLFNADTVDKALATLMTRGLKVAGGDRLGKTIIFAKNTAHADFIAERFNVSYPEYRGEFARVITHQNDYAQDLIDKFSARDTGPHIAISVDMLDTGIDVPEVVNLVFFKLVRSKTKFWQMIGRGTRLCPDLFGPGRDKDGFLVFDLCQNVEFFDQDLAAAEGGLAPSLGQRLFERRADLLLSLDRQHLGGTPIPQGEADGTRSKLGLRWDLARRLHREVAGMNMDNILVRPHRRHVEVYADFANWHEVTPEVHEELTHRLAGLPTAFREDEHGEPAKRFDLLVLRLQLAQLRAEPGYARLRAQVQEIASALLDQTTIPAVRREQQLLDELTTDEWWQDVTLPMLESMRRRVRALVRLIEKTKRNLVYTDFEDQLGEVRAAELRAVAPGADRARFEARIGAYLRSQGDQLVVRKLRRNRQVSAADLGELKKIFIEAGLGTGADLDRAASEHHGLGLFLRSLTGLDREAAAAAFEEFQAGKAFTANQLHFLRLLVDMLAKNGVVDAGQLYDPPFTSIAPRGPEGIFPDADVDAIVAVLQRVRATAAPEPHAG